MTVADIPEGFSRHFRQSPLTDPWEPIYSRRTADAVIIGLRLDKPHTNSRGLIHGGLIATLADNAMGLSCGAKLGGGSRLVTVGLAVDFIDTAHIGQWLAVESDVIKGRRHALLCAMPPHRRRRGDRAGERNLSGSERSSIYPKCQSLISTTRSMKARTFADNSREVG